MTQSRFRPTTPDSPERSSTTSEKTAMRIIVPLQGVVQGRGGLVLGSAIPCALFYFLQLYLRRNRPSNSSSSSPSSPTQLSPSTSSSQLSDSSGLTRSQSRNLLSPRNGLTPPFVSSRASLIGKSDESAYYVGLNKVLENPYDELRNPNGVIQLGLAENKV
ncbi:hypothetical protein ACHQM5_020043 [Ranunculus cassubicifolius]